MLVHVLSGWLASSYLIRRAFLQHIRWRVSVESVISERVLAISHEEMVRLLHGCLFVLQIRHWYWNWKVLSKSEYHYYHQGRKWNMPDFWNRDNHSILSLEFIGSFEAADFSFTNLFFPPSRISLLPSGRSLCCLPYFAPTASRKKRAAKKHPLCLERNAKH